MRRILPLFFAVYSIGITSGCGSSALPPDDFETRTASSPIGYEPTDDVPEHYHFIYSAGLDDSEYLAARSGLPYKEIHFARTECYGKCPAYMVKLHSNGTAEYHGKAYVPNIGTYTGEIEVWDFARLCWTIDRLKLQNLSPDYSANWTDDTTATLSVTNRDSETVLEISDYGRQAPIELWAVHGLIDGLVGKIDWKLANSEQTTR